MSGKLKIRADHGVPPMAVDVVAPDLRVVGRVMLTPGRPEEVDVPSEGSFLRAYLPSGETVVLKDPGNLDRLVTLQALAAASPTTTRGSRPARPPLMASGADAVKEEVELPLGVGGAHGRARLLDAYGDSVLGGLRQGVAAWSIQGPPFDQPRLLRIVGKEGWCVETQVPGNATGLWLTTEINMRERSVAYHVRVQTSEPAADTILNYLARGEFAAVEAMSEWVRQSEGLLASKHSDPYAASVGAYLLLNQRDFARLHNWPRNLADSFGFLPDGCIIWAWQMLSTRQGDRDEVRKYLLEAVRRGVPIYRIGTRLLLDGLKLLGEAEREVGRKLKRRLGVLVQESPLTMCLVETEGGGPTELPAVYDVTFGGPEA